MLRQVPMGRAGRVEEVAHAALFLPSDKGSYITGAELWVGAAISPPEKSPAA
jgi:NAD(P)-dependent dehydrogenase (short-subunit alcohol dehydrogenase family)